MAISPFTRFRFPVFQFRFSTGNLKAAASFRTPKDNAGGTLADLMAEE
jgi:hypothetical protein